jgi:hypothetical protein
MPLLHVALQEGFANDRVSVWLNGAQVAQRTNVTTRNQIGFADAVDLEVPSGQQHVEVRLETRPNAESASIRVEGDAYVGVNVDRDGRVVVEQSDQPFRYM